MSLWSQLAWKKSPVLRFCAPSAGGFRSLVPVLSFSWVHQSQRFFSRGTPKQSFAGSNQQHLQSVTGRRLVKTYVTPGAPLSLGEVERRVVNVFRAFEKVHKDHLHLDAKLAADLGLDSLDVVEVVIAVEEDFNLEIPDVVADKFETPQDIVEYLYSQCGDYDVPEELRVPDHEKGH